MAFPSEYKEYKGVEDPLWYDWIAYYEYDGVRYSRNWVKISDIEMCKPWYIYTVQFIRDGDWPFDYHYEVLDVRPDVDGDQSSES